VGDRRLDIQGLRAVAVLAVVVFHAGLPLHGGFAGVDVFFVISGFVIARMLRREFEATGKIDFRRFYVRRFKRLTPALALMVGVTVVVSALVLSPLGPQQRVASTGFGAMSLLANWTLSRHTGYFDAPAASNPLLHTWSLSVEEQFYLAFPALLALGWYIARRRRMRADVAVRLVTVVGVVSFVAALIGVNPFVHSWLLGFYSPLTRGWEFAAGALLALAGRRVAGRAASGLAAAGAGLLVFSFVRLGAGTPWPSIWTTLPVAATVMLLASGETSRAARRVLSARPLVLIGDWSYSIYLWHWPLIVFASVLWPTAPSARAIAAAVSLAPALASYNWVERPVRRLGALSRPGFALLAILVIASPVAVDGAMAAVATNVWKPRFEAGQMPIANMGDIGQDDFYRAMLPWSHRCTDDALRAHALRWDGFVRCRQSQARPAVGVALIGDSHAEELFIGLGRALTRANVAFYIVNDAPTTSDPDFARILAHVVASPSIRVVVVSSSWSSRGVPTDLPTTLRALTRAHKRVFLTDDAPSFPFDAYGCKYRSALLEPANCTIDAHGFWQGYAGTERALAKDAAAVPGVDLLHTAHTFCGRLTCDMARGGLLFYRDANHLNVNGSNVIARAMLREPAFAAAVAVYDRSRPR